MKANISTAVMARRTEPADSLDFFPTPPWATRALCRHVLPAAWSNFSAPWPDLFSGSACDPACGAGHMARVLAEFFPAVSASDVFPYGYGAVADFLHPDFFAPPLSSSHGSSLADNPSWIITNPPFRLAGAFIDKALHIATAGVAMLVRTAFLEGAGRFRALFSRKPPQLVAQFVERVPMHRGRWVVDGKTATAYCWLVWLKHPPHDWRFARTLWIPPCRKVLTKPDDWLNFSGCCDLPKAHKALSGGAKQYTLAELQHRLTVVRAAA